MKADFLLCLRGLYVIRTNEPASALSLTAHYGSEVNICACPPDAAWRTPGRTSAGMLWMDLMVIDRGKSNNDRGTMGKLYRDNHEIRCRSEIKQDNVEHTAYTRAGQYTQWCKNGQLKILLNCFYSSISVVQFKKSDMCKCLSLQPELLLLTRIIKNNFCLLK